MARAIGRDFETAGPPEILGGRTPSIHVGRDTAIALAALASGGVVVVGMALQATALTALGSVLSLALAVLSPAVGLGTLAFMGPLNSPTIIPAPGYDALLVAAIALGCVYRLPIDRPAFRPTASLILLTAFVAYVFVQQIPDMLGGYSGAIGHMVGFQFGQLVTGFGAVVVAGYVLRGRSPYPFLAVGLSSAILAAILAVVTYSNPAPGPPFAGLISNGGTDQRAVGSFFNPNYFGSFEAVLGVTALGLALAARSGLTRLLLLVTTGFMGLGMALSLSRGALIAFVGGLAALGVGRMRLRNAILVGLGLLLVVLVVFPLVVQWRLAVTHGTVSSQAYADLTQSDDARLGALLAGPKIFLSAPIFGIGWGHYAEANAQISGVGAPLVAHNWYISTLAEQGLVGAVLWVLLLLAVVAELRRLPPIPRSIGFAAFGAYVVGGLFLEAPSSFQTSAQTIIILVAVMVADWTPTPVGSEPSTEARAPRRGELAGSG